MATTLKIDNFSGTNIKERAVLDADIAAGATSITLVNNQNIANGDFIYIGNFGSETGEILTIQSVTGSTLITTGATKFVHNRFDPVIGLIGNQIKLYRAANTNNLQPADGGFALVTTINIDSDQLSTVYTDAAGSDAYWYKFTYYNGTTLTETDLADSLSVRGGGSGNYVGLDAIRDEAGFRNNRNISDSLVSQFRAEAQSTVNGGLNGLYTLPFAAPINPTIERITLLYAAGYLQINQHGQTFNTNDQGVNQKIAEADGIMDRLKSGQLVIQGADGGSVANSGSGGFRGYPNASTAYQGGGDFKFRATDNDGYTSRQY